MERRIFISGFITAVVCKSTSSQANNGSIVGTDFFFDAPKQPLIDLEANTGFFEPFEPDELPANIGKKVSRSPKITLSEDSSLVMLNINTNEKISLKPMTPSGIDAKELKRANYFMRDWRLNEVKPIDPNIILGLLEIQQNARRKGFNPEIQFLSGYRSEATNTMLRKKTNGVAANSLHIQAKAVDFSMPGVPINETILLAKAISIGGVGGYNNFVHIDSGRQRYWGSAA